MSAGAARASGRVVGAFALIALLATAFAAPGVDDLGLYYDEAFLAQQARDFLEPDRVTAHAASVRTIELFGRPFPVRNAAYLGSLKSQLLIPAFALLGADVATLRLATFATALLALLFTMLLAERLFSAGVAIATGLLVASDPGFLFFGRFEWGPFTTNFLCRAAGLWALTVAWQSPRPGRRGVAALLGGAALGLGVFSRADFAIVVGGCALGVLLGHPGLVVAAARERRRELGLAAAGLIVASAPMWTSALDLLGATGAVADRGDLGFRVGVLGHVLDGSRFHRLMQTGGLFEAAGDVSAPSTAMGAALALALLVVGLDAIDRTRRDPVAARRDPARGLLVATIAIALGTLALPGAVRAHHQLNVLPFAPLLVACAGAALVRRAGARRAGLARGLAAAALALLVAANLRVAFATAGEIAETGGRGRFSLALHRLAAALDAEPGAKAVSLDWGFHEPLLFLTDDLPAEEAIWAIPRAFAAGRPWTHEGDAGTRYLVHDAPYDLFGLGPMFLRFARREPPGRVEIETWTDATGAPAFTSVRFLRPHTLRYTGRFTID